MRICACVYIFLCTPRNFRALPAEARHMVPKWRNCCGFPAEERYTVPAGNANLRIPGRGGLSMSGHAKECKAHCFPARTRKKGSMYAHGTSM